MSCMSYAWLADPKEIHDLDHYVLDVHWSERVPSQLPYVSVFASIFLVCFCGNLALHCLVSSPPSATSKSAVHKLYSV